jgi:drug/metabolite transporter (DMT)-like permease
MSLSISGRLFRRINIIAYILLEVILFTVANVTAKNDHHPGIVSDVFWVAFLIGLVLLVLAVAVVLGRRLGRRTP